MIRAIGDVDISLAQEKLLRCLLRKVVAAALSDRQLLPDNFCRLQEIVLDRVTCILYRPLQVTRDTRCVRPTIPN